MVKFLNSKEKEIEGALSIIAMVVIPVIIINYISPNLLSNGLVLLGIVIIVGLINGFIFHDVVKKSILDIVVFGDLFVVLVAVLFYFSFPNNSITNNSQTSGLESIGIVFVLIIMVAVFIIAFIGLIVFGVIILIPALIGKQFKERNIPRSQYNPNYIRNNQYNRNR